MISAEYNKQPKNSKTAHKRFFILASYNCILHYNNEKSKAFSALLM
jgi:hypothetical protein